MIELDKISKTYQTGEHVVTALSDIDLKVDKGEFVSIIGPSGAGKSTLLHIIGGLDLPTAGKISVDGQDLSKSGDKALSHYRNRKVGFVFQAFNLHPIYNALENVALPLVFSKTPRSQRLELARDALEAVGLADRARHRPNQLSGGERQRVSIARALVIQPRIILADEPTGNLDSTTGKRITQLLVQLSKEMGITTLIVTHNMNILPSSQRTIFMRDGRIAKYTRNMNN